MQTATAAILAKSLATTISRGATLLTKDGYTVAALANRPGVYTCTRPEGRPVKAGEKASYTVDMAGGICECGAFAQHGTCKHLIGVTAAVAQALALVGPMISTPVSVNIETAKPSVPQVGRYGSDQWKKSVAADFC